MHGPPMTFGNMCANEVRRLDVHCPLCRHEAVLDNDQYPDDLPAGTIAPRMVCTRCGGIGAADLRPNWRYRLERPTLRGGL